MKVSLAVISLLSILLLFPVGSLAQCCGEPNEGYPYLEETIDVEYQLLRDRSVVFNGTMMIKRDLLIENSSVVMAGKGMIVSENATLTIRNSTMNATRESPGFYMDLIGDANIYDSIIDGCMDQENGFFGIYVEGSTFRARNLTMTGSGMVRVGGGGAFLRNCSINGIISYAGNITMEGGAVTASGISQIGDGDARLTGVTVSTELPFSSTAGIYCTDAGSLTIENVTIFGTYNGGISAVRTPISVNNTSIDLSNGTISMELNDLEDLALSNIRSTGCELGIFIHNCSSAVPISNISVSSEIRGMDISGNDPLEIQNIEMIGGRTGMSLRAPSIITNSSFFKNQVAIIIEDGSMVDLSGNSFIDYSIWGIEEESWSSVVWSENDFRGSPESIGTHAWWGWVPVDVKGPLDVDVEGAEIMVDTPFGSSFEVYGERMGLIWGYFENGSVLDNFTYDIRAKWGSAERTVLYKPSEDDLLTIELPMTDIRIDSARLDDGSLLVDIGCNGSKANEVTITVFVNDTEWTSYRTTLEEGGSKSVRIQDLGLPEGEQIINISVSSQGEYKGASGIYLENNRFTLRSSVEEKGEVDNRIKLIVLLCLVLLSIFSFLVPIMLRERD